MPSTASVRRAQKAEREETKKSEARDKAKKDADDAYWAAAGDGKKSKAAPVSYTHLTLPTKRIV